MNAIEVQHLRRVYHASVGIVRRQKKEVVAVKDISFEVKPGELFGLLGPNGAGKTTTVKMLTTLLLPTAGTARVLGHDVVAEAQALRGRIGFIFGGERGLYWRLSARDNLRYFASLYRIHPSVSEKRIPYLLELVGLGGREKEKVEGYSRGMKQRLHIARTLLHDPELLFLGRAFFHILDGMLGVLIGLALGVTLLGLDLSQADAPALLVVILVATISTSGLGLLLGSLSLVTVNVFFVNNVVYFLLLLFSGANIPRGEMPGWMYGTGEILPLTRGIEAARQTIAGAGLGEVSGLLLGELAIGLIYAGLGFAFFRWVEYQARKRGTIESF